MNDQPSAGEQNPRDYACILGDSEDSGEELSSEGVLEPSWEKLPVLERLGLSSMEMTEQEVEDSFVQLALAFRCDQYTLKRRLQAEEHDRCVAEENLHMEMERTKDTLQSLKVRCQDREHKEILEKLELSLKNIGGTVEGIITAAEQLGTVHQEARVNHAVELMVSHVENLNRRHATESSELEETRKLVYRTRRFYSDSTDDGDVRHSLIRQPSQQYLTRRRVSITLIPTMTQINDLESKLTDSVTTNGDTDSVESEGAIGQPGSSKEILSSKTHPPESTGDGPSVQPVEQPTNSPEEEEPDTDSLRSPLQDTLRHRRKCVAAKEPGNEDSEEDQGSGTESERQFTDSEDVSSESCAPLTEQLPSVTWLSHCYWTLLGIFLMALYLVILLGVLLWRLRAPLSWL